MKRKELFEFEDFPWVPAVIRTGGTNLIMVLHKLMGTAQVIAHLIKQVHSKKSFTQITDLGSGSGGPMPDALKIVNSDNSNLLQLVLTDLHPHSKTVSSFNAGKFENVTYYPATVNATHLQDAPKGLKTMVASFHHMNPTVAKKILQSAQDNKEPILIYEIAKNNIPFVVWLILLPISLSILIIMSLVMTLFVRPLTWQQLLFTYLIPVIPLLYAWDGQASLMRTYTFKDIEQLLSDIKNDEYRWEISDAKKPNGKPQGYYVMGYPKL